MPAASSAPRAQRLFVVLAGFFIANAIIAEFIGVKIFALEDTLGLQPFEWHLFAQSGSLNFTAGTLLWPIVFIMTDVINEFYGRRGVRFLSWLAVGLIAYAFLFAYAAIALAPASWWVGAARDSGVPDLVAPWAQQVPVPFLPESTLVYLLGSRYCETDLLSEIAWARFGQGPTGWARVQAICDFVHRHIRFGYEHARRTRSAWEA